MKGVTQVPTTTKNTKKTLKKNIGSHFMPFPFLNPPSLELSRSAQCHSGIFLWIRKPMDCTVCIFSADILSHFNLQM